MFKLKCKDASAWTVRMRDERLPMPSRARLHLHLLMCKRCREFNRQLDKLEDGVNEWRERSDR